MQRCCAAPRVRSPQAARLRELVAGPDVSVTAENGVLEIAGLTAEQVGEIAAANRIVLHELMPVQVSLEEAFMDLTRESVEFQAADVLAVA
jgi:ABC-2 type transport system ATP-binding protein